jgi:hypothetical protein
MQLMATKVADLQPGAYLMALDYPLGRCEGASGRKVFVFREVPEEVLCKYSQGHDCLSARKLLGAYRALKGLTRQAM